MVKKIFKAVDYGLILIALVLFGIGIVALYSANGGVNGNIEEVTKQFVWFLVGFACMFVVLLINYEILRKIVDTYLCIDFTEFGGGIVYYSNLWSKELVSIWKCEYSTG